MLFSDEADGLPGRLLQCSVIQPSARGQSPRKKIREHSTNAVSRPTVVTLPTSTFHKRALSSLVREVTLATAGSMNAAVRVPWIGRSRELDLLEDLSGLNNVYMNSLEYRIFRLRPVKINRPEHGYQYCPCGRTRAPRRIGPGHASTPGSFLDSAQAYIPTKQLDDERRVSTRPTTWPRSHDLSQRPSRHREPRS